MAQTLSLTSIQTVIARAISSGIHDRGRIERAATLAGERAGGERRSCTRKRRLAEIVWSGCTMRTVPDA